ncbi:hypothetical protein O6H91_Y414700 [Diphasiastrum complanatum]|nr:hypothetical protein O6H91_Y414700 [Diphasiastrum complanatum]
MRTMRTTRMGSARPTTDMQPPQSQPQPQPQLKPSLDVLPAEDDTLRITASRELLTHAQLLGQPEDPNPTAHQTAEAFHPLQRPQGHRVSSQNGAGQPGQQTTVGQTPALATVSAYMPLLSMQTNNPNPNANPKPKSPQIQAQQQPMQHPSSKHPLGAAPLGAKGREGHMVCNS